MRTERVFITGCGGMLGNAVYPYFKSWYSEVLATDKDVNEEWLTCLDIRDDHELQKVFKDYKPDLVLHLAAETDLEFCETHPEICKAVNETATGNIAQLANEHGSTLIYISTAGVFDGKKTGFYNEDDLPKPLMVYGQTKYDGELLTRKHCPKSFVVRAGWMMGGGRRKEKKFIYKILKQIGEEKKEIFAVDDKWGTPTYTYDFAMNLFLLLETRRYGTYHMVCEGKGTRYDVAREILHICERPDIKLTRVKSDFFADEYFAPRPFSEMMCNNNLFRLGINHMRPWKDALRDYIETKFSDYIEDSDRQNQGQQMKALLAPDGEFAKEDQRRENRNNYTSTVYYTNGKAKGAPQKGIAINYSNSGLSLYLFETGKKGDEVVIMNGTGTGAQNKRALIQWVNKEKCGLYKAGIMYL